MSIKCNRLFIHFSSTVQLVTSQSFITFGDSRGNTRYSCKHEMHVTSQIKSLHKHPKTRESRLITFLSSTEMWRANVFQCHFRIKKTARFLFIAKCCSCSVIFSLSGRDEQFMHRLLNSPHLQLTRFAWMHCFTCDLPPVLT